MDKLIISLMILTAVVLWFFPEKELEPRKVVSKHPMPIENIIKHCINTGIDCPVLAERNDH